MNVRVQLKANKMNLFKVELDNILLIPEGKCYCCSKSWHGEVWFKALESFMNTFECRVCCRGTTELMMSHEASAVNAHEPSWSKTKKTQNHGNMFLVTSITSCPSVVNKHHSPSSIPLTALSTVQFLPYFSASIGSLTEILLFFMTRWRKNSP